MQWDHDIDSNYGPSVQEMLLETLVIKKYKMCMSINPVSITEKVAVPTLQDLLNITAAGIRTEEKADEWDDLVDFTLLEEIRDVMAEKGTAFFNNVLEGFKESGIDVEDPLQMIMVLKNFNYSRFETFFHPSVIEKGEFSPYYPTVLGRQTIAEREEIVNDLAAKGLKGALKNKRIVLCSADGHSYGLLLVEGVLAEMGAGIVNGGVDTGPAELLDLADEEGIYHVGISVHNGQALDYARLLVRLAAERNKAYSFFMGGRLNAILAGHSEASDVSGSINELGVKATNDFTEIIKYLAS